MLVESAARARASRQTAATPAIESAERVEWLIDNADAYRALVLACRSAHATIWISQLALDADCYAYDLATPHGRARPSTTTIALELITAAQRGVQVRVLLNASLLLDTAAPLRAYFAAHDVDPQTVRVRGVSRFPQLLHAKMVIVDDAEVFLVGSPFANGYWDDSRHAPLDARRPKRELGGRPVHDVSSRVTGRIAHQLGAAFAEMWNDAEDIQAGDDDRLEAPSTTLRSVGHSSHPSPIRLVRTAPGDGPVDILPALLDGISRARTLIYIEHQYLSARPIVDALVAALLRERALEVIVLLNQNPDVTAYRGWQNARLRESGLLEHPRVGLFALWTSAVDPDAGPHRMNQVFVHSKVVAIDDRWITFGSANLDGVSLHSYGDDFSSWLGRRVFRGVRNFDVNIVLDCGAEHGDGERVRTLRRRLWQEHLGGAFYSEGERPADGWLPLWRSIARRNVAALNRPGNARHLDGPFVLPYSVRSTPKAQLADVGVALAPAAAELCFAPSWLEVHCSPSWVRNMFG